MSLASRVVGKDLLLGTCKPEQPRYGHLARRYPTLIESVIRAASDGKLWPPVRVTFDRKVLAHASTNEEGADVFR